ncbi:MAG: prepilin-type N-terminal cleavage/methylation domain-containing protein [Gammaproteobacteria bacterium]|nr:prepilin-type N-terminal cleavage/methylation domain-containing protein [Gammaproteobacteria bacterium]
MKYFSRQSLLTCRGFTLVEIMISLTLLSVILMLLFSSLHIASRSWTLAERTTEEIDELRLAGTFVSRQLGQIVPVVWMTGGERRIAFKGMHNELHFASTLPAHRGGGGLYLLTLKVNEDDGNRRLDLIYRLAKPEFPSFDIATLEDFSTVSLIEGIETVELTYYGAGGTEDEPTWHSEWQNLEALPRLVRVQIKASDPAQVWPALDIAIHPQYEKAHPEFVIRGQSE